MLPPDRMEIVKRGGNQSVEQPFGQQRINQKKEGGGFETDQRAQDRKKLVKLRTRRKEGRVPWKR